MPNPISYKDLFDLSNPKDLKEAIKVIEKLDKAYLKLIKDAETGKTKATKSINELKKAASGLGQELDKLKPTLAKDKEEILKINDGLKKMAGASTSLNVKIKELNETNKKLVTEQRKVAKGRQEVNNINKEAIKLEAQLGKLSGKQAAENAKLTARIKERRQELRKTAEATLKGVTIQQKEIQILNKLTREFKEVAFAEGLTSKRAKELNAQLTVQRNKILAVEQASGQFTRNVGGYRQALGGLTTSFRSLATALGFSGGIFLLVQAFRSMFTTLVRFDKQVIAVQKTTDISNDRIEDFKNTIISLGKELKGVSIQGLLESAEVAGQLGIRGTKGILKFAQTIEQLKLTSNIASEESVRAFAKFISISKDTEKNADRLGSVIVEMGNNFATSEVEVLNNSLEIQRALSTYNVSAQAVIGLGAATSALGISAELSRSSLLKTFRVLSEGIQTGKNLTTILSLTGQSISEMKEEFGRDASLVFLKFIKGLRSAKEEGQDLESILKGLQLGGLRVAPVIGTLATKYDLAADAMRRVNNEYIENIALTKEVDKASESLSSTIGDTGDAWDGLVLSVDKGSGVMSVVIRKLTTEVTDWLDIMSSSQPFLLKWAAVLDVTGITMNKLKFNISEAKKAEEARQEVISSSAQIEFNRGIEKGVDTFEKFLFINGEYLSQQKNGAEILKEVSRLYEDLADKKAKEAAATKLAAAEAAKLANVNNRLSISIDGLTTKRLPDQEKFIRQLTKALKELNKELFDGVKANDEFAESFISGIDEQIRSFRVVQDEQGKIKILTGEEAEAEKIRSKREKDAAKGQKLLDEESLERKLFIIDQSAQAADLIGNQLFTNGQIRLENELVALQNQKDFELELAGDNSEKRAQIEKKFAEEERKIRLKQAKSEKNQALFNIAIQTAVGIANAVAQSPLTFGLPFSAFVAAQGVLQAALVASQPLPAFEKGGTMQETGIAITSEKGREMIINKKGQMQVTGSKGAELREIEGGSQILTNAATENILNSANKNKEINDYTAANILKVIKDERGGSVARQLESTIVKENDLLMDSFKKSIKMLPEIHQFRFSHGELQESVRKGNTTHHNWKRTNSYG